MEMLHARLTGSTAPARHEVLPVQLIARRSTCRA
jgi:DNA-binding LacI/PurR family transcriptional regulator